MLENIDKKINSVQDQNKKVENFLDILEEVDLEENRKSLWKEIYKNAIEDRLRAELLYENLYPKITEDPANHSVLGLTMSKYLERMEKCNNQILKLAELVQNAERKAEKLDAKEIYKSLKD